MLRLKFQFNFVLNLKQSLNNYTVSRNMHTHGLIIKKFRGLQKRIKFPTRYLIRDHK